MIPDDQGNLVFIKGLVRPSTAVLTEVQGPPDHDLTAWAMWRIGGYEHGIYHQPADSLRGIEEYAEHRYREQNVGNWRFAVLPDWGGTLPLRMVPLGGRIYALGSDPSGLGRFFLSHFELNSGVPP